MPSFVATDARGDSRTLELPRDVLEACGGVLEALAADDAPNAIALADVGLADVSVAQFARAVEASYARESWDRLALMHKLMASADWGALEAAVAWLGAREATEYVAASKIAATDVPLSEFAGRLRGVAGEWELPTTTKEIAAGGEGLVFGLCVRRAAEASATELQSLFEAACWVGSRDGVRFLVLRHQSGGLAPGVALAIRADSFLGFRSAAVRGHVSVLEFLWPLHIEEEKGAGRDGYELRCGVNDAFRLAAREGHLAAVEWLWQAGAADGVAIDPTWNTSDAHRARKRNEAMIIIYSMRDARGRVEDTNIESVAEDNSAFFLAARNGHVPVLEFLWRLEKEVEGGGGIDPAGSDSVAFREAAMRGHVGVLDFLWRLRRSDDVAIDHSARAHFALRSAAWAGHADVVAFLWRLHKDDGAEFEPASLWNSAFCLGAKWGHVPVLALLWRLHKEEGAPVDPAYRGDEPFVSAAEGGHVSVLEFLWRLHKEEGVAVDPAAGDNEALRRAAEGGHVSVLEFLWRLRKEEGVPIDPAAQNGGAVRGAAGQDHVHVLEFLWRRWVEDGVPVDLTAEDNAAFRQAAERGCLAALRWLWDLQSAHGAQVDQAARACQAGRRAAESEELSLGDRVRAWLGATRTVAIDPTCRDHEAWLLAASNGHAHVVEFLWSLYASGAIAGDRAVYARALERARASGRSGVVEFLGRVGIESAAGDP